MRKVITEVYEFKELSNEAKEKAVENYRTIKQEDCCDCSNDILTDSFVDRLEELGFYSCKFQWDCSYCQGDYFSINSSIELDKGFLAVNNLKEYEDILPYIYAICVKENEVYVDLDIEIDDEDLGELFEKLVEKKVDNLKGELQIIVDDLARKFKKEVHEEYEYILSYECIVEDIKNNGGEFEEDGTRA